MRRSQVVASVIGPVCVLLAQWAWGATEEQIRKAYENCVAYNVHFARAETEDEALQWAIDKCTEARDSECREPRRMFCDMFVELYLVKVKRYNNGFGETLPH